MGPSLTLFDKSNPSELTSLPCSEEPVSLSQMLARRDWRQQKQRELLASFGCPIVWLTLVNPGPVKDTVWAREVFKIGLSCPHAAVMDKVGPSLESDAVYFLTGPEAYCVLPYDASQLKSMMIHLEQTHPLGRLWDLDVISPAGMSISRQVLGESPRACLLCGNVAHACARSQAHSIEALRAVMQQKLAAYQLDERR